jgi:hypothetical protein
MDQGDVPPTRTVFALHPEIKRFEAHCLCHGASRETGGFA